MTTDNLDDNDEAYRGKVDELVKFAVSSAKRDMRKADTSHARELLQSHIRTLIPKNNEADQS